MKMKLNDQSCVMDCPNVYGKINGQDVGVTFSSRRSLGAIHNSKAQIAIGPEGALSIVLTRKENLLDRGVFIAFSTGETQKKSGNLEPEGKMGQSLAVSVRSQLPIRVIRGASLQNCFAPSSGYRYDGLYICRGYDPFLVRNKILFKFILTRIQIQDAAPWERDGTGTSLRSNNSSDDVEIISEDIIKNFSCEPFNCKIAIGDSFCLGEDEYTQIDDTDPPTLKTESTDDTAGSCDEVNNTDIASKPMTIDSSTLCYFDSTGNKMDLARILKASGIISKEIRITEKDKAIDVTDWEGDCSDENYNRRDNCLSYCSLVSESESEEESAEYKFETVDVKDNFEEIQNFALPEMPVEIPVDPLKVEYFPDKNMGSSEIFNEHLSGGEEVKVENLNDSYNDQQIDHPTDEAPPQNSTGIEHLEKVEPVMKWHLSSTGNDTGASNRPSFVHLSDSESSHQEYIYIKTNDSPEDYSKRVRLNEKLHVVETEEQNYAVRDLLFGKLHDRPSSEESSVKLDDARKSVSSKILTRGIQSVSYNGGNFVIDPLSESPGLSMNDRRAIGCPMLSNYDRFKRCENWSEISSYEEAEPEIKVPPHSPEQPDKNETNIDFKINRPNVTSPEIVDKSSDVFCRKCTPPSELIEPLLGKLTSVFSCFYSEFYCKCRPNSTESLKYSEYFKRITNSVIGLNNHNVEYVSAIVAFLLFASRTGVENGDVPLSPLKTFCATNKQTGKSKTLLKDEMNRQYELVESDGKYALVKHNFFDGERIDLESVSLGGQLISTSNDEEGALLFSDLPHKRRLSMKSQITTKPLRKRKLKRKTRETDDNGYTGSKSNLSDIPSPHPFLGFSDYDVRLSESQRDLTQDALSPFLNNPSSCAFKGFPQTSLKQSRTSDHFFETYLNHHHRSDQLFDL